MSHDYHSTTETTETTWPECTAYGCQHAIRHPSLAAAVEAARADRATWVDEQGHATCVCHRGAGFPCDEAPR